MQDLFKEITRFNTAFGNKVGDISRIDSQLYLIKEEFHELEAEIHTHGGSRPQNVRKEACDLIVVSAGLLDILNPNWAESYTAPGKTPRHCIPLLRGLVTMVSNNVDGARAKHLKRIIQVCCGVIEGCGGKVREDLSIVNASNFSKFCEHSEEVAKTSAHYIELGVETVLRCEDEELVAFISKFNQEGSDGKVYTKGKLLKPVSYRPAVLK